MLVTLLILILTIILILTPIVLLFIRKLSKTKALMLKKQLELQEKKRLEKQVVKQEVKEKCSLLEVMKQEEESNPLTIEVSKKEEAKEEQEEFTEPITITANNVEITEDDFQLVQAETKIHDVKIETKATTFLKDAFRRFCKNKSSVVGAAIIGLIFLLTIFVPMISPHDVENSQVYTTLLPPKLFNAGTGFWDGTVKKTDIVYDTVNECPADYNKDSCTIYNTKVEYFNSYNKYATGGTLLFVNSKSKKVEKTTASLYHKTNVKYSVDEDMKLVISILNLTSVKDYKIGEYRIILTDDDTKEIVLKDWSTELGDYTINISEKLKENNYSYINGKIKIELKQNDYDDSTGQNIGQAFIGINKFEITSNSTDESRIALLEEVSITDANETVGTKVDDIGNKYWASTGNKEIYQAKVILVDFVYDEYNTKLGLITDTVGKTNMESYVAKGWCTFDYEWDKTTKSYITYFTKLSDKCPVESVISMTYNDKADTYSLQARVTKYKQLGYDKMPKFLFGTDDSGFDIITLCFKGLRISLLIAIASSAVCFIFGLCWGAISGYFGGNVDLIMERFCDILGGIPWIVMMTLAILLIGNNIVTFGLALCLTGWMGTAARTRTQFYRFKGREYILASRTLGAGDFRLIFKHILPNAMGTIITSSVLMIPSTIFSETTLSYLNLGLQGSNSFGNILSDNQAYISSHPMLIVFPAIIISLIMISFNLFGNGLRDAFNPSLKGSE